MLATLTALLTLGIQTGQKPFPLMVGDPAPKLNVDRYFKGDPVKDFKKGQVYVVEFWATWCGPCKENIPHLTELQKKLGDKVKIVGISVWEPREKDIEPFVKEWDTRMEYTVAADKVVGITTTDEQTRSREAVDKGMMSKSYLVDSGWAEVGIPCSFIVNGDGRIAWIGNPEGMEKPLMEVVEGKHDLAAATEKYRSVMELELWVRGEMKLLREAKTAKDFDKALTILDGIFAKAPFHEEAVANRFTILLKEKKDVDAAIKVMNESLGEVHWSYTVDMTSALSYDTPDLNPAQLEAALAATDKALTQNGKDHTWPLMVMARLQHRLGRKDQAVALVDRAIAIAKDNDKKKFEEERAKYAGTGGSVS